MGLWSKSKDYVKSASGARGQYRANRDQRLSEEFVWPASPQAQAAAGSPGAAAQITSSGRASGTEHYAGFECPAPKKVQLSEEHLIQKLSTLRAELRAANLDKADLKAKIEYQERQLRSFAKRIVDLERKVFQLGKKSELIK